MLVTFRYLDVYLLTRLIMAVVFCLMNKEVLCELSAMNVCGYNSCIEHCWSAMDLLCNSFRILSTLHIFTSQMPSSDSRCVIPQFSLDKHQVWWTPPLHHYHHHHEKTTSASVMSSFSEMPFVFEIPFSRSLPPFRSRDDDSQAVISRSVSYTRMHQWLREII